MTGCGSGTIALWKQRGAKDGLAGLAARHRGSKPTVLTRRLTPDLALITGAISGVVVIDADEREALRWLVPSEAEC